MAKWAHLIERRMDKDHDLDAVMANRLMRVDEAQPDWDGFVDSRMPEHMKALYSVVGHSGVAQGDVSFIKPEGGFSVSYVYAEPGKGAITHAHPMSEVFIPITGRWRFFIGDDGEWTCDVGIGDCLSAPPDFMRRFENISDGPALLAAVIGGYVDGPPVWYLPGALDRARATGLAVDEDGGIDFEKSEEWKDQPGRPIPVAQQSRG